MSRWQFYYQCFRRATRGAYRWAEIVEFSLMVLGGAAGWWIPGLRDELTMWLWGVPALVLVATFAVAWTMAPYAMYRELELNYLDLGRRIDTTASTFTLRQSWLSVRDRIEARLEGAKRREPTSGVACEMERRKREHLAEAKADLKEAVAAANELLAANGFYPMDTDKIASAADFRDLHRQVELFLEVMRAGPLLGK